MILLGQQGMVEVGLEVIEICCLIFSGSLLCCPDTVIFHYISAKLSRHQTSVGKGLYHQARDSDLD